MKAVFLFLHIVISVVLIVLVALMQQKHEGISGIMGGMQNVRGIKGMDEGMRRIITYTGAAYFVSCMVNSYF